MKLVGMYLTPSAHVQSVPSVPCRAVRVMTSRKCGRPRFETYGG